VKTIQHKEPAEDSELDEKKSQKTLSVHDYIQPSEASKFSIKKWKLKKQKLQTITSIDHSQFRRDKELSQYYSQEL
jgi:hypothetical protein